MQVVAVQDGDSLIVRRTTDASEGDFRLRLYGIDAPEGDQKFGREARDRLNVLVRGRGDLLLRPTGSDRYGRTVGILYHRSEGKGNSINRQLVEEGLARWYDTYGGQEIGLDRAEREARRRRRGIWTLRRQVAPWVHRRAQRQRSSGPSPLKWMLAAAVISVVVLVSLYVLPHAF